MYLGTRAKLQKSLEEVHGRLEYVDTLRGPFITDIRQKGLFPNPKHNSYEAGDSVDFNPDDVPDLLTSRTALGNQSSHGSDSDINLIPGNAFFSFKSKVSDTLESLRKKGLIQD